jgi:hypothetical protein
VQATDQMLSRQTGDSVGLIELRQRTPYQNMGVPWRTISAPLFHQLLAEKTEGVTKYLKGSKILASIMHP